jgi:hypothetical protein
MIHGALDQGSRLAWSRRRVHWLTEARLPCLVLEVGLRRAGKFAPVAQGLTAGDRATGECKNACGNST